MKISRQIVFLFSLFCGYYTQAFQIQTDINSSQVRKNTIFQKLNKFVSYHVTNEGKHTNSPNLEFIVKVISIYHYNNHKDEIIKNDEYIRVKPSDIRHMILSNKFSNVEGFDGIFKINSKIMFIWKPEILKTISIFPKRSDVKDVKLLMSKLRKQKFLSDLSVDTLKNTLPGNMVPNDRKRIYIKVGIKSGYRNVNSIDSVSKELKKRTDISDVVYVQMFTGINETDTFFEIKSKIKGIGEKSDIKKKIDPFKLFVDSLEKH